MATIGERNFVLYRGVVLSQGLVCTIRVHLGLSEVAFMKGVLTLEVTFVEGCPHFRSDLVEGCPL